MCKSRKTWANLVAGALLLTSWHAQAALGDPLFVAADGHVTVVFEGSDAGYDSALSIHGGDTFFANHATDVGSSIDLGYFTAGTPLDIVLNVITTGYTFHVGDASLNPDGEVHANVIPEWENTGRTYVGFEDIYGTPTGYGDYNDYNFSLTNVVTTSAVPEPTTLQLSLLGMAALLAARRRTFDRARA